MDKDLITVTYRQTNDLDVKLDVYVPKSTGAVPVVLFFHGGGLCAGDRKDLYFPLWLKDAALEHGWIFLSADYHLLVPATAHDQVEDVKALGEYLSSDHLSSHLSAGISLDLTRLFLAGVSAGGYMDYLYALHATPKPKAVLSLFGMGGDLLMDRYVLPNPDGIPFYGGALPFTSVNALLGVIDGISITPSSGSTIKVGPTGPYCDDGRAPLFAYLAQEGSFMDYFTGQKGLAASLAKVSPSERATAIAEAHRNLFPQLRAGELPPTILIHGDADTVVYLRESEVIFAGLQRAGVKSELVVVEDAEHGLCLSSDRMKDAPGAPEAYAKAIEFLETCL